MSDKGLVSIIMPLYNTAEYTDESIKSVINQTYQNWELIIADDCSTDGSGKCAEKFLADKRIKYFKNEFNEGAAVTRNRALRRAKGRWVAFLDSDDLWKSDKLEKQINFMIKHKFHFSYTKFKEINEKGEELGLEISGPSKITCSGMHNYCWMGCLTVMYEAKAIGLIQIADIKINNDYAMWLKVCKKANCYLLDEVLAMYRRGRRGSICSRGYLASIKCHYELYRKSENKTRFVSAISTLRNLFFGVIKKIIYVKRYKP